MKSPLPSNDRRNFLKTSGAIAAGLLTPGIAAPAPPPVPFPRCPSTRAPSMPCRPATSVVPATRSASSSLGGQASIEKPNNFDIAVPIIERALDLGVNYIDTSSIYGGPDRWSEQYVGRVMATRRNEPSSPPRPRSAPARAPSA